MKTYHIKAAHIKKYINYLKAQERTEATIEKYNRDITALRAFLQGGFFSLSPHMPRPPSTGCWLR